MYTPKVSALEEVETAGQLYDRAVQARLREREALIDKMQQAKKVGATHQEIADAAGFARQRVGQFLAERKQTNVR